MKVERDEKPVFKGPITITLETHEDVVNFKALTAYMGVPGWSLRDSYKEQASRVAEKLNEALANLGVSVMGNIS